MERAEPGQLSASQAIAPRMTTTATTATITPVFGPDDAWLLPALRLALVDEGAEHLSAARRVVVALGALGGMGVVCHGPGP